MAAGPGTADPIRVATYNVEMARDGPGLLLRDILDGQSDQVTAVRDVILAVRPDLLVLTSFDYDHGLHALRALAATLAAEGADYDYLFAYPTNAGLSTGRDMDGDGRVATARDAQGYGEFAGQGGMAVLSRFPIQTGRSRDFSEFRWRDLPGALLDGDAPPEGAWLDQRLSSVGHWDLSLALPDGREVRLWAWHATPPVFDGPEDRNGRRNHDEAAFWLRYLEGDLPAKPVEAPFVLAGDANLDPVDGDGLPAALEALLGHERLQDPEPRSAGAAAAARADGGANLFQRGDPALDTADWRDLGDQPGNLRVDYVLPSSDWRVLGAGVWWPEAGAEAETAALASRHRMVWVDIELP